ncbi:hypothetical protein BDV12DRAFT_202033 [Aspergillus spectabilis]
MPSFTSYFLLASLVAGVVAGPIYQLKNSPTPNLPFDPDTTGYCSWWWDNDGSVSCEELSEMYFFELDDFLRWNPSVTAGCENLKVGFSYCVKAYDEPGQTTTSTSGPTTTIPPTSTSGEPTSTAPPSNGVETPLPIQPGMVGNCDAFHLVKEGDAQLLLQFTALLSPSSQPGIQLLVVAVAVFGLTHMLA